MVQYSGLVLRGNMEKLETNGVFSPSHRKWTILYLISSWSNNMGQGIVTTIVGPTQPYLAKNIDVSVDVINLAWSIQFIGYLIGSLISGIIFKRYLRNSKAKLVYMGSLMCIAGLSTLVIPFLVNFPTMGLFRFTQCFCIGAFMTADASLIIYTMGPIKSRPFTNAIHAICGVGCFLGTILARPFLPPSNDDMEDLCGKGNSSDSSGDTPHFEIDSLYGVQSIAWPFLIGGIFTVAASMGYIILATLPLKMPIFSYGDYSSSSPDQNEAPVQGKRVLTHWKTMLVFVFIFYVLSCGIERIFQPMAFTFGICGPLALQPAAAIIIDSCYNGGFMCGRIVSVGLAGIIRPRNMIYICLLFAFVGSIVLLFGAGTNVMALYCGTAILGFFVSWQFGSCYSFIAGKGDITGSLSSIFFIAGGLGSAIFPTVSGFVFTWDKWGPMGIIHITAGICTVQIFIFTTIWLLSRKVKEVTLEAPHLDLKN
ncbi:sodium-dependent glucose transporter 1A isoform X1 [Lepeophtheirus salmonis]|uniref:sodium-dependent glucose transporter 1A isoform X1 n=2 Tax=Lepeophtheirus salmonis TaxID=72036 RepID=UPI001AE4FF0C|nr:sodium-dependent glucose transporter 1A-like isoform X1 [Lepeophtheirus salmonis]